MKTGAAHFTCHQQRLAYSNTMDTLNMHSSDFLYFSWKSATKHFATIYNCWMKKRKRSVSDLCTYVRQWCTFCSVHQRRARFFIHACHPQREVLLHFFIKWSLPEQTSQKKKEKRVSLTCAGMYCWFFHKISVLHWLLPLATSSTVKNMDLDATKEETSNVLGTEEHLLSSCDISSNNHACRGVVWSGSWCRHVQNGAIQDLKSSLSFYYYKLNSNLSG